MKNFKRLCFVLSLLFLTAFAVSAQNETDDEKEGKLNFWTKKDVYRANSWASSTIIKDPRFGRHKGFDRMVFEFEEALPGFVVGYEKLKQECWDNRVSNKTSLVVRLFSTIIDGETDEMPMFFDFPRGQIKLKIITEVADAGCWAGSHTFAIGIQAKTKFRVLQLSNPARIVIDIKY